MEGVFGLPKSQNALSENGYFLKIKWFSQQERRKRVIFESDNFLIVRLILPDKQNKDQFIGFIELVKKVVKKFLETKLIYSFFI